MARQSAREIIGFNDTWFIVFGILFAGLLFPLMVPSVTPEGTQIAYFLKAGIAAGFSIAYWATGRVILIQIRRRFPGHSSFLKRILLQILLMGIVIFAFCGLCKPLISAQIHEQFEGRVAEVPFLPIFLGSLIFSFAVLTVYDTIYALNNWKKATIEAEQLRKENLQAQLDGLRSQVNPHFLFNSLNTLTSLVHEQPDLSVEFIQHLSTTYRHVLEFRDQTLISLADEMKCIRSYLFLLHIRFEDGLKVHMDIPAEAEKLYIVPLALQMLVENAIKHNVASKGRPLLVEISVQQGDRLVVRNNLQRKNLEVPSTQSGLDNIRTRYHLISGKDIEVVEQNGSFSVALPLIKLEKYADSNH